MLGQTFGGEGGEERQIKEGDERSVERVRGTKNENRNSRQSNQGNVTGRPATGRRKRGGSGKAKRNRQRVESGRPLSPVCPLAGGLPRAFLSFSKRRVSGLPGFFYPFQCSCRIYSCTWYACGGLGGSPVGGPLFFSFCSLFRSYFFFFFFSFFLFRYFFHRGHCMARKPGHSRSSGVGKASWTRGALLRGQAFLNRKGLYESGRR